MKQRKYYSLLKNILQFEIVYKLLVLFIFSPLLRFVLKEYLKGVSVGIAFNQDMIGSFLSLKGLVIFLILVGCMIFIVYYNLYVVIQISILEYHQRTYTLKEVVLKSFQNLKNIHWPSIGLLGIYILGLLPLVHVGYLNNYIARWDIPEFVIHELSLTGSGQFLLCLIYVFYYGLFIMTVFVPLYMVLTSSSMMTSIKKSSQLIKQTTWKQKGIFLMIVFLWVSIETALMSFLPYPFLHNRDFNFYFMKYFIYFSSFRYSVLQYIGMYLLSLVAMTFFLQYLIGLFCRYETHWLTIQDSSIDTQSMSHRLTAFRRYFILYFYKLKNFIKNIQWVQHHRRWLIGVCILSLVIMGLIYLQKDPLLHQPWVIGHRGSGYCIENTYEAVANAAQHQADYAEIDIQLSQDGIPIVYHDTTLSRLSDSSQKVSDLKAAQFENILLEDHQQQAYPLTLEHLIQKMKNEQLKIGLLIELKPTDDNAQEMVDAVIEVVQKQHFASQTIFMSLHYPSIQYLSQRQPEWWVGYCIYGSIGDIDETIWDMNIDFLAIEENRASTSLIQKATSQMLPVYVWTVDDTKKMTQYLQMGVSGIISNYPDLAREQIDDYLKEHQSYYFYQISINKRAISSKIA